MIYKCSTTAVTYLQDRITFPVMNIIRLIMKRGSLNAVLTFFSGSNLHFLQEELPVREYGSNDIQGINSAA